MYWWVVDGIDVVWSLR